MFQTVSPFTDPPPLHYQWEQPRKLLFLLPLPLHHYRHYYNHVCIVALDVKTKEHKGKAKSNIKKSLRDSTRSHPAIAISSSPPFLCTTSPSSPSLSFPPHSIVLTINLSSSFLLSFVLYLPSHSLTTNFPPSLPPFLRPTHAHSSGSGLGTEHSS